MIAPRSRLLFWVAMAVVPCGLLLAARPESGRVCAPALGALAALCAIDAIRAKRVLARIEVELPSVARLSQQRPARLAVRVRNPGHARMPLRFALVVPVEIRSLQEDLWIKLPIDHEWSHFTWGCLARRKGLYRASGVCLEMVSPLGFWAVRRRVAAACELRVYPNLQAERRNLAALFLNRGAFGLHVQRQIGKGREFEKLREYLPGDGFEDVHWKATAKRGKPVTKMFQIERTQELYVVIDSSRLSARAARHCKPNAASPFPASAATPVLAEEPEPVTALDRHITAALVLGMAAEQQGDLFGLITFSDKVDRFVRARNGKTHFHACRDALYTVETKTVSPDYEELFTFIRLRLRRRALLVFLTALDDPVLSDSFVRGLELIRHQHLVLVNMVQPPGVAPLFEGPEPDRLDELYQHLGGHFLWENLCELQKVLQRRGVQFSLLQDERLSLQLVQQYLTAKRRQAL